VTKTYTVWQCSNSHCQTKASVPCIKFTQDPCVVAKGLVTDPAMCLSGTDVVKGQWLEVGTINSDRVLDFLTTNAQPKSNIHVVLTAHSGYTKFRTSHLPNRTGSEPRGLTDTAEILRKLYPGATFEAILGDDNADK
jgi:hypothetical protein